MTASAPASSPPHSLPRAPSLCVSTSASLPTLLLIDEPRRASRWPRDVAQAARGGGKGGKLLRGGEDGPAVDADRDAVEGGAGRRCSVDSAVGGAESGAVRGLGSRSLTTRKARWQLAERACTIGQARRREGRVWCRALHKAAGATGHASVGAILGVGVGRRASQRAEWVVCA
eukprot:365608-Chlamydomonas_euryale.AAC.25